jgi:dynein heavy chain
VRGHATSLPPARAQVPAEWADVSYPSTKPLSAWLRDLEARLLFVSTWMERGRPKEFWLPALFNPHALLTVALYYSSITSGVPLDMLSFAYEFAPTVRLSAPAQVGAHDEQRRTSGGEEGGADAEPAGDDSQVLYVYGLVLEGARWDPYSGRISELHPRQAYSPLPTIGLRPTADRQLPSGGIYVCPVYKTVSRSDVNTASGRVIPNFVTTIELPTGAGGDPVPAGRDGGSKDASERHLSHTISPHWIMCGVAAFLSEPYN